MIRKRWKGEERMTYFQVLFLFFMYSFLGWVLETGAAAIKEKRYVDRSALFGPVCCIYGVTAVLITLTFRELHENWFFLFLGSSIYATVIEWIAGHVLEHYSGTRWWDYSKHRWNLDGYISLSMSMIWGFLGMATIEWGNPLLLRCYGLIPLWIIKPILLILLVIFVLDVIGTILTLNGIVHKLPTVEAISNRLGMLAVQMGTWILSGTEKRITKAYPNARFMKKEKQKSTTIFAQGCSFYKIVLLFFVGAFLGDVTETIFCRISAGVWMSRSSVVWGPFSIVWGLAIAIVTVLLYKYKDRSDRFLFLMGTFLGGAYEYLCSVFTELVFGTVFWDYSKIPFNLGGRINLLYCFFWGIAAVVWFKMIYPYISEWIEKIPIKSGKWLTWILIIFMSINVIISCMALKRCQERRDGKTAEAAWEQIIDERFDDQRMKRIYPNMIHVE